MKFFESVYRITLKIPAGKVVTYGDLAKAVGSPRAARQVGWALHANPYFGVVPCHRVLNREGRVCAGFAFGGAEKQIELLCAEGVEAESGRVDLTRYRHSFTEEEIEEALDENKPIS